MKLIEVCHIHGAEDRLQEYIDWFAPSKSFIKKSFSKKELSKKIKPREIICFPINFVNSGLIYPSYQGEKVEVLYEDENLLALNKPTKIHMHPLTYDEGDNLLSFLRENNSDDLLAVNKDQYDRGLLFRLDYETSGVCFYAKNDELYKLVRENFLSVAKRKEYVAVVVGSVSQEITLTDYMIGSESRNHKMKSDEKLGQKASLKLFPLSYNEKENLSLVKIELETGLRHQIRFQLAKYGHPILGDELYGDKASARLYLHALRYEIKVEKYHFDISSKIPKLFSDLFDIN